MLIFSLVDLMDEQKCYEFIVNILHPDGLHCPKCEIPVDQCKVHRRDRAPLLYFRCPCGSVYNAFSDTVWKGTHHRCSVIVRILQGFAQGTPTLHLAKELGIDRKHLLERRHKLQGFVENNCFRAPLPDNVVEADELYQNAGEKKVFYIPIQRIHNGAVRTKSGGTELGTTTAHPSWVLSDEKVAKSELR